jgi:outer membrane protein assembly factor BamD (BamD/ComL family)
MNLKNAWDEIQIWLGMINKTSRNWRLVIKEAEKFKNEFGQKEKIDYWVVFTQKTKNGIKLHDFMEKYKALEKKKQELAAMQKSSIEMPNMIAQTIIEIKILTENLEHI